MNDLIELAIKYPNENKNTSPETIIDALVTQPSHTAWHIVGFL